MCVIYNISCTHGTQIKVEMMKKALLVLRPDREAGYCDEHVCVCLSVCDHISVNYRSDLRQIFVHVTYGLGSVLL